MPLKLIRRTASGDLQLDGLPVYIAGIVAAATNLPSSGEAIGEGYWVGNGKSKLLYLWNGDFWGCTHNTGAPGKKGDKKGDKGESGLTIVVTDETLSGDGTPKNPLTISSRHSSC